MVHPHIQRGVLHIGEAPLRVIQLGGGDAQVKEHPVHIRLPGQDAFQLCEVAVDQPHPVHPGGQPFLGRLNGGQVPVDADEAPGGQPLHNLPGVPRPAQGAVYIDAFWADVQGADALVP